MLKSRRRLGGAFINPAHKSMPARPPNRRLPPLLNSASRLVGTSPQDGSGTKGSDHGDQTKRLTAFKDGTGGIFHRQRARRSAVSGRPSFESQCRSGDFRAGGPHGVAHPSARPEADRHRRLRLGAGWASPKREIRAGDVVVCPPGEKHWHGATATTGMSHIAVQEALDGKVVDWLEKVSDKEYLAEPQTE
jgi:hypothetical protein